jgi:NADPH:quinone reductase-like Zn-dependent oxidoreductase
VDSTGKLDMLRSIGADYVIDYTQEDFTKGAETYDVIFDVMGKSSFSGSVRSLKQNGRYLLGNAGLTQMVRGRWTSMRSSKKVIIGAANQKTEDLLFLKELIEAGKIKPVIDSCYPLEQIAEAHRYVETGQKKGNVVITVEQNGRLTTACTRLGVSRLGERAEIGRTLNFIVYSAHTTASRPWRRPRPAHRAHRR